MHRGTSCWHRLTERCCPDNKTKDHGVVALCLSLGQKPICMVTKLYLSRE
jgi:hypothetical protein